MMNYIVKNFALSDSIVWVNRN